MVSISTGPWQGKAPPLHERRKPVLDSFLLPGVSWKPTSTPVLYVWTGHLSIQKYKDVPWPTRPHPISRQPHRSPGLRGGSRGYRIPPTLWPQPLHPRAHPAVTAASFGLEVASGFEGLDFKSQGKWPSRRRGPEPPGRGSQAGGPDWCRFLLRSPSGWPSLVGERSCLPGASMPPQGAQGRGEPPITPEGSTLSGSSTHQDGAEREWFGAGVSARPREVFSQTRRQGSV